MSSIYKVIEIIGSSDKSWEDAAKKSGGNSSKNLGRPKSCRSKRTRYEN